MARLPFIGYVGPDFRPGGFVLMAINPGGGNFDRRTAEDNRLCPALHRLQNASTQETRGAFADLVQVYLDVVPTWNLWRIFSPILEALNTNIRAVAFLNVVPFRTKGDASPPVRAQRASWRKIVSPVLAVLAPSQIIALGKKAGSVIDRFGSIDRVVTVPRTNGDTYVSQQARVILVGLASIGLHRNSV